MLSKILSVAALAGQAAATIYYAGVAESSGEFGVYSMIFPVQKFSVKVNRE
jgi:endoglucanase